jgi:hypothetical protein
MSLTIPEGRRLPPNRLFEVDSVTHELVEIDPTAITVKKMSLTRMVDLQLRASKAVWRPAPGRKQAFEVAHRGRMIGLMFLASPVINLACRDDYLNLPTDNKGAALRNVADLSACVGFQPLAWHWNIGKLIAMLAQSNEIADWYLAKYGDPLEWVTTTSLQGRGSQYNRLYKFLGYTRGYGHAHVPDSQYEDMLAWMRRNFLDIPSASFGSGSNARMRRIAAYQKATGQRVNLHHGQIRGVYIAPASQGPMAEIVARWHDRWGRSRYERTKNQEPPYQDGLSNEAGSRPS